MRGLLASILIAAALVAAAAIAAGQRDGGDRREAQPARVGTIPCGRHAFDARRLLGLRLPEARALAQQHGCTVRVVRGDSAPPAQTDDFRRDRINVADRREVVVAIEGIF